MHKGEQGLESLCHKSVLLQIKIQKSPTKLPDEITQLCFCLHVPSLPQKGSILTCIKYLLIQCLLLQSEEQTEVIHPLGIHARASFIAGLEETAQKSAKETGELITSSFARLPCGSYVVSAIPVHQAQWKALHLCSHPAQEEPFCTPFLGEDIFQISQHSSKLGLLRIASQDKTNPYYH